MFAPAMVFLNAVASALRALKDAMAAAMPMAAMLAPAPFAALAILLKAVLPSSPAFAILVPMPRIAEAISSTCLVSTPMSEPSLPRMSSLTLPKDLRSAFDCFIPLVNSEVSAPIMTFALGSPLAMLANPF